MVTTEYTSETEAEQALRGLLLPGMGHGVGAVEPQSTLVWRWNPETRSG
ncbi:hypothetical protein [Bifidobacterium imperatoris]|nr:hypothetical protein [Bifidobacterium imperatoris]